MPISTADRGGYHGENDFSEAKRNYAEQAATIPEEFTWLPEEGTCRLPEGQGLARERTTCVERSGDRRTLQTTYRCGTADTAGRALAAKALHSHRPVGPKRQPLGTRGPRGVAARPNEKPGSRKRSTNSGVKLRRRPRYHIVSLDQTLEDGQVSISELIADPRPTPEQALERSELRALVTKVACGLPAAQRAALRLRQGDGLSIREAARRLGVPEGTLKAQLARGRTALTRRFQKAEGKRRTKAAIPDAKAKRTDGCAGNGPDSARCEVPMPIAGFQAQQGGYEAWVGA